MQNCFHSHLPAAKMLLEFPLSKVIAVTGPGISLLLPTAVQDELSKENIATLAEVPSDKAIDPEAKRRS